jgi:hypothetical protein
MFGGRIEVKESHRNHPHWKPSYCWRADWQTAINFLYAIEPWVRIKSEQILAAKLWDAVRNRGTKKRTIDDDEVIDMMVRQVQWLNRKGRRANDDVEPVQAVLETIPAEYWHAA